MLVLLPGRLPSCLASQPLPLPLPAPPPGTVSSLWAAFVWFCIFSGGFYAEISGLLVSRRVSGALGNLCDFSFTRGGNGDSEEEGHAIVS